MPFLTDLASYIETNTTGLTIGGTTGTIGLAQMHDTQPATMIGLYETGGPGPAYVFSTDTKAGRAYEQTTLQVLSRSTAYATAAANARRVYTALSGVTNTTINSLRYLSITALQTPFDIGHDSNNRAVVSCNYLVTRDTT